MSAATASASAALQTPEITVRRLLRGAGATGPASVDVPSTRGATARKQASASSPGSSGGAQAAASRQALLLGKMTAKIVQGLQYHPSSSWLMQLQDALLPALTSPHLSKQEGQEASQLLKAIASTQ